MIKKPFFLVAFLCCFTAISFCAETWYELASDGIMFKANSTEYENSLHVFPYLDKIAASIKEIPVKNVRIRVYGWTAAVQNSVSDYTLSLNRANRVIDALIERGIATELSIAEVGGATAQWGNNKTEAQRSPNRRVTIRITFHPSEPFSPASTSRKIASENIQRDFDDFNAEHFLFKANSSVFADEDAARRMLDRLAAQLEKIPVAQGRIQVTGYTAAIHNEVDDTMLSQERASKIITQLLERGVAMARFEAVQIGGPTARWGAAHTEADFASNRRATITVSMLVSNADITAPPEKTAFDNPVNESLLQKIERYAVPLALFILLILFVIIPLSFLALFIINKRSKNHKKEVPLT